MLLTSDDMILSLKYSSSRAASILGSQSGWVCPTCLVPHDFLWDLSDVIYPLRTRDGTLRLIEEAEGCSTKAGAYKVLLAQSIRNIPVFLYACKGFRYLTFFSQNTFLNHFSLHLVVYSTFCADVLHQIEQGIWGQHIWKMIKSGYLSSVELQVLDDK